MENIPILEGISPDEVEQMRVCFGVREERFRADTVIYDISEGRGELGLLTAGSAVIQRIDRQGGRTILEHLPTGSVFGEMLKHRIFFMKGDNRRIPGWMQMHYRMAFDEEGYPQLYVFTGCRAFRRTVPGLLFSETEPEDLDTRMEDHVADESRYLCMARPIPPRRVETALPVQDDPLNMLVRR